MGTRGLLLLACLFAGSASAAATGGWAVAGSLPAGGFVGKIVVNPTTPSILYAAAQQGVYESTDSGASWTRVFKTLNPPPDIAIDPQSPSTVYVVSTDNEGGFYKTTDGGATWAQMDSGILGKGPSVIDQLVRVAVDPVNEGVVYVGGNNTGVYKSTDGGAHWTQSSTGIVTASTFYAQVLRLVVDPVSPAVLYASVDTSDGSAITTSLYKSTDGAATWAALTSTPGSFYSVVVEIDPADHKHLIASFGDTVYTSPDSGTTWQSLFTASSTSVEVCAFDPSDSSHVLVGTSGSLYVSTGGGPFSPDPNVPANGIRGIAFDPVTPSHIYLGSTAWGVLKSGDGGSTWSQSTTGIPDLAADHLLEGSDGILYMSTAQSGIFKSLDQGATWAVAGTGIAGSLPTAADAVDSFAQDPTAPAKLYVGSGAGLYRSSDSGNSWAASNTGMPFEASVRALAVDPEVPATVYAGLSWFASSSQAGIYKSVDGGATWAVASSGLTFPVVPLVNAIAVDPKASSVVYVAPYQNGLFKSMDGGTSWTESDTGMGKVDIFALAVDPADSTVVYASAVEGFYKSSDGGATWAASGTGISGDQISDALLIDPVDPSTLYLSTPYWGGGAYVSKSGAASWQALNSGVLAATSVTLTATLIDPVSHTHIYSAGSDGKFYVQGMPAPPVAKDGVVSGVAGKSVSGTLSASSPYTGQALSFSIVAPGHGQVDLDASTGKFIYTPGADLIGVDSFTFDVTDTYGTVSNTATEQVTVADIAPTANDGSIGTTPDTAVAVTLSATRAYTGQLLTFDVVSKPAHGALSIQGNGKFTYTPARGFRGTDSFTFYAMDQFSTRSNTATVQVTVADIAPSAAAGSLKTTPDTAVVATFGVTRAYPTQALNFSLASNPVHGTAGFAAGSDQLKYTPATGFAGADSFSYKVTDAYGASSAVATVSVTVSDIAPKANGGILKLRPHTSSYNGVLKATAAYSGQTLTYQSVGTPSRGVFTITDASTGAYTFTASPSLKAGDSFSFKVVDQWGTVSNSATITILVL